MSLSPDSAVPVAGDEPLRRKSLASGPSLARINNEPSATNFIGNPIMPPFVASRVRKFAPTSKSTEVIARFGLRMAAVVTFAVLGGIGFERGLTVMLWMSAILATVIAMFDREEPLDATLNHWDEATAYAALCCLACTFEPAAQFG
jgi:hypothetical protein